MVCNDCSRMERDIRTRNALKDVLAAFTHCFSVREVQEVMLAAKWIIESLPLNGPNYIQTLDGTDFTIFSGILDDAHLYLMNHCQNPVELYFVGETSKSQPPFSSRIEDFDFSIRTKACLRRACVNTLGDLVLCSESQLKKVRNLGSKSLDEIKSKLEELGLSLCPNDNLQDFPDIVILKQRTQEEQEKILMALSPREREILELRFGLKDGTQHTMEEVGKHFGVTRERIRQIEAKALRRINILLMRQQKKMRMEILNGVLKVKGGSVDGE